MESLAAALKIEGSVKFDAPLFNVERSMPAKKVLGDSHYWKRLSESVYRNAFRIVIMWGDTSEQGEKTDR